MVSHLIPTAGPGRIYTIPTGGAALCGHGPSIPVLPNVGASRGGAATEPIEGIERHDDRNVDP